MSMHVTMRLASGNVTIQVLGREVTSREWLPEGCVGILFVFDSPESAEKFYGPGTRTVEIEAIDPCVNGS